MGRLMGQSDHAGGLRRWQTPLLVGGAGLCLATSGMGTRSVFGLFLPPMTEARGWSREAFAFAMAMQNLTVGLLMPVAASTAARFGPVRVLAGGACLYAFGIWLMTVIEIPLVFKLVGVLLVGAGL